MNCKLTFFMAIFLAAVFLTGWTTAAFTMESFQSRLSHLAIGGKMDLSMSRAPNDVRFGVSVNTPYLFGRLALRGTLYQGFFKGIPDTAISSNEIWTGYSCFSGGLVIALSEELKIGRPYTEMGWIGLIPNSQFTDTLFAWGIYGLIGFDFLFKPDDFWGFFIEAGACGMMNGGTAEKFQGDYVYGSGIILTAGLRFYL